MSQAVAVADTSGTETVDAAVAELRAIVDDLDRSLAEERAMAVTLIDTIRRLDEQGEDLRRIAKG